MSSLSSCPLALAFIVTLFACLSTADKELLPDVASEILPFMDNSHETDVIVVRKPPPGYEPATTDAEWDPIYQANLYCDLLRYKAKVAKARHPLNLTGLAYQLELLKRTPRWRYILLVLVRDNAIYWHLPTHDEDIRRRGKLHVQTLAKGAARLHLQLPDTLYSFNLYDEPVCEVAGRCVVPVFSVHKRYDTTTKKSYDADVLLPHLGHSFDRLLFFPWHQKDSRAFLRATMQSTMDTDCVRVQLARMSSKQPGSKLLDVGFSSNRKTSWNMPESLKKPYVGMSKHAQYKFLINADGHVSSSRMGYIMQTNSVILKQRSLWIEYFYRSLVPSTHVLEYSPTDILFQLIKYQNSKYDKELRNLANNSQHFCAKYLTTDGKVRYTARALHEYTQLFGPAMPAFVRALPDLPVSELRGQDLELLISKMRANKGQ